MRIRHLVLLSLTASSVGAQTPAQPAGPSLAESVAWLTSEGASMLNSHKLKMGRGLSVHLVSRWVSDFKVDSCRMSWRSVDTSFAPMSRLAYYDRRLAELPLRAVDVGAVRVDTIAQDSVFQVLVAARAGEGPVFIEHHWAEGRNDNWADTTIRGGQLALPVNAPANGARVVAAIKRTAILCGAPASPF